MGYRSRVPRGWGRPRAASERGRLGLLLLVASVVTVAGELVTRLVLRQPVARGFRPFAVMAAVAAVAALLALTWSVTNRFLPSMVLVSGFVALLGAAHVGKVQMLGKPLMPWDLLQAKQIVALFPTVLDGAGSVAMLSGVAAGVLWAVVAAVRRPSRPLPWRRRVAYAGAATVTLLVLALHRDVPIVDRVLFRVGVVNAIWDQNENLERNGVVLSTIMNARSLLVRLPGYSEAAVREAMMEPREAMQATQGARGPGEPVDVVVWMVESMFDPTRLANVTLSRDPMPNMRAIAREHSGGELISPVYGGGTANAEFEVLTGLTTSCLPEGAYPYQHYVSKPIESLASVFKSHGYRTAGIHNFHKWYWQREKVYPLIGFDRFVAQEEIQAPLDGPYPSDEPLVEHVLQELDADARPSFIYAITMVSHGPYFYDRDQAPEVRVTAGLEGLLAKQLTNYASALWRADRVLGRLIEALAKRERATVVVVFGDHLPALGFNRELYLEAGYVTGKGGTEEAIRMGTVPVAIWSNRPRERRALRLGMNTLGPEILRAAGLRPTGWFAVLERLSRDAPVVTGEVVCAEDGRCASLKDPPTREAAEAVRRMQLITHDRLLGERYSLDGDRGAVSVAGH